MQSFNSASAYLIQLLIISFKTNKLGKLSNFSANFIVKPSCEHRILYTFLQMEQTTISIFSQNYVKISILRFDMTKEDLYNYKPFICISIPDSVVIIYE